MHVSPAAFVYPFNYRLSDTMDRMTNTSELDIKQKEDRFYVDGTGFTRDSSGDRTVFKITLKSTEESVFVAEHSNAEVRLTPRSGGGKPVQVDIPAEHGRQEKKKKVNRGSYNLSVNGTAEFYRWERSESDDEDDDEEGPDLPPYPIIVDVE